MRPPARQQVVSHPPPAVRASCMRQRILHTATALVHTYSTRPAQWNRPPRHFVPPLRRGELATYRCGAKFPSTEGRRRSRRGGLLVTRECVARARCALCVSLRRNKKTPVGRFFISGADNRAPALGNKLPNFVLFATAHSPLVSSRLRVACLDYSYANLRFESGPDRGYKNTGGNAGIFITGADNRIISLCFITLQNCACAQPAYFRPPFCGGSNGFFAGSNPYPCAKIKKRPLGAFLFLGRITGFEPATPGTTNQCSNQLSYIRHTKNLVELIGLEPTTPCMPCKCSTN